MIQMKLFSWRMQNRQCGVIAAIVTCGALLMCVHLLGELRKLGSAVARLQDENRLKSRSFPLKTGLHPRRLSAASDQPNKAKEIVQVETTGHADEDMVVIYNRVPKTGSTSFAGIAYDLCKKNHFNVLHVNTSKNAHVMSMSDQMKFVRNVTEWSEKKPAIYHGHTAFLDFSRFGVTKLPIYINLIRDPLERLVSYYYFVRYGDDFRPFLRRRKAGNTETLDECVEKGGSDCDPVHLWLQIPFFCGQDSMCWEPGNRWALEMAKENILRHYLVVGVTEELRDFVALLEAVLPRFFRGAVKLFEEGTKSHLRRTSNKVPPKPETLAKIKDSKIWKMENEFYQFVRKQFHFIKSQTFELVNGHYVEKSNRFHYEKIRPR
ncbi:heparan sulfate 2-O-sulfotransferase 1-like isoform X2 [Saccostrea echinata]|uniref:heparan sulfate 2-O-sulfotransferase 1-like isoform X2 n=1 Tax=Saccostrea echinata TaxID=191078 RepID=UPI002A836FCC|nr:heparan sulfate 2-O-sulfotransferase 1-like isoform X2 [Saccostrea echinata]